MRCGVYVLCTVEYIYYLDIGSLGAGETTQLLRDLLLWRTSVQFPAFKWRLTTIYSAVLKDLTPSFDL